MIEYSLQFIFKASNNEAEYEALIERLNFAINFKAKKIIVYN